MLALARLIAACGAVVATLGMSECGGGARDSVIVRVGDTSITKATLAHWISVMAPERVAPDPPNYAACIAHQEAVTLQSVRADLKQECQRQYEGVRQKTLDFLISARWLLGEASERGLKVSNQEVEHRLRAETRPPAPTGVALADLRFRITTEVTAEMLRRLVSENAGKVTLAQAAKYYREHRRRFLIPEKRYFDIDNLQTEAAAQRVKREVESGKSLASMALHESIERPSPVSYGQEEEVARKAIFAARPNVLTGPIVVHREHSLFEVRRVVVGGYLTLAQVQGAIEKQLAGERQRRALASFTKLWRTKWIARTNCQPEYVVQKCSQSGASKKMAPEDPYTLQ